MSDDRTFRRMWGEFEFELIDEMKLRQFDLHPAGDGHGNFTGLVDMDDDERMMHAVNRVIMQALVSSTEVTGVKVLMGGLQHRLRDENGDYPEFPLIWMPGRRGDGTYADEGS